MSDNIFTDDLFASYQHWAGIATFLRCPYEPNFQNTDIGIIGFPYGGGNPVEHMQYLGPRTIRNRSMGYGRLHREFHLDPFKSARIRDLGDVPQLHPLVPDLNAADAQAYYEKVFKAGIIPVSIGGDHSITWPILRAARATTFSEPVGMIHFDSHCDSGPEMGGTKNNAGGFRIGTEDGLIDPKRTVQIGIRGALALFEQDDWSNENFASVITTASFLEQGEASVVKKVREIVGDGPTYLSFDLDALDPSEAPGVADPEMNGLTMREIMKVIHGFRGLNLMGADIVCYCPPLDNPSQMTAIASSYLLHEFVTLIAEKVKKSA
jgi:guanidinopropionase